MIGNYLVGLTFGYQTIQMTYSLFIDYNPLLFFITFLTFIALFIFSHYYVGWELSFRD